MGLRFWFRVLDHVTLGLAAFCLAASETFFLPYLPWFLIPYAALLWWAFQSDGRWLLSSWGANLLGLLLAAGAAGFANGQLYGPGSSLRGVPLAVAVVPYVGPLLMALLAVKLFRPRGRAEFWLLQGIGLLQVGLGCVLSTGPVFGGLMALYFASALACLVLHQLVTSAAESQSTPEKPRPTTWLWGFTMRWWGCGMALTLVVFLMTPRPDGPAWDPFQRFGRGRGAPTPRSTGFADKIDLNGAGVVEPNLEEAFRVRAYYPDGRPYDALPPDIRWRGAVLDRYDDGVWSTSNQYGMAKGIIEQHGPKTLPDFGPDEALLHFKVNFSRANGLFVADPAVMGPPGATRIPVMRETNSSRQPPLFFEHPLTGTLTSVSYDLRPTYEYVQAYAARADPSRTPANIDDKWYVAQLAGQGGQRQEALEPWTMKLLERLAADPRSGIRPESLQPNPKWPTLCYEIPARDRAAVGRALADYFANSGEFLYSLEMRRQDLSMDPVMDFLINVRQGHCARYASALTLVLRSQGVPARLVNGFHGAEHRGGGLYVVRQSEAHSWVEVLVPREEGAGEDWLALDPTPSQTAPGTSTSGLSSWWRERAMAGRSWWQRLIVGYNRDRQTDVFESIRPDPTKVAAPALSVVPWFAGVGAFALLGTVAYFLARRRRRRARPAATIQPVYARLLRLLARKRLVPKSGQTPREFAAAAGSALRLNAATASQADAPVAVVNEYYRVHFGGQPLSADEAAALDRRLKDLATVLRR